MNRLPETGSSPNCVSSEADPADTVHRIEPLSFSGSEADARLRLLAALAAIGARVTGEQGGVIRAEHKTPLLGFVDDLHFFVDAEHERIEMRSASRVGYWDLGANRKRLERLRRQFAAPAHDERNRPPPVGV